MHRTFRLLGLTCGLVLLTAACNSKSLLDPLFLDDDNVRVLFIGNSLTYTNDLPEMFVALARQAGNNRVQAQEVAFPDFALEDHWSEGSARKALKAHKWEYVVMQQGSSALPQNQIYLRDWAARFTPEIRAAGAEPVMFMVWPQSNRLFDVPNVLQSYRDAAAAINGIFAPAGDGWTAYGSLQSLYADGLHPTPAGTYIAALVLLERTVGIKPEELPANIPGVPMAANDVRDLQQAARVALDRNPSRPKGVTPSGARTPGHSGAVSNAEIAQPPTQVIDSAAEARAAFRAASQASDQHVALAHLKRAANAWPTQSAYWTAVARVGARLNDTNAVRSALESLGSMEAGSALLADTAVQRLSQAASLSAAMHQLTRGVEPLVRSRTVATITDSTVFAEGIDANPVNGMLYVASIRHRTILEVRADGSVRDLHLSRHAGIGAMLGVRVARDGRTLYATTAGLPQSEEYRASDSALAAIVRVRIQDGAIENRWDVARDGARHLLGDLAVSDDGTVYASDSYAPVLYRLRPAADTLDAIRHPLFRSLQGVAPIPGSADIMVADYSHGLLRVNRDTHAVTRIVDAPGTTSLGIDGIVWHNGSVIAVQNGIEPPRIARFALDANHSRIEFAETLDRRPDPADEPTIGTLWRGGFVYVANSQWEKYDDNGHRRAGTTLRPTLLLCLPLSAVPNAQTDGAARNGTRSTASVPPPSAACKARDAASP